MVSELPAQEEGLEFVLLYPDRTTPQLTREQQVDLRAYVGPEEEGTEQLAWHPWDSDILFQKLRKIANDNWHVAAYTTKNGT